MTQANDNQQAVASQPKPQQQQNLPVSAEETKAKLLVFSAQKQFEASNSLNMDFMREAGFAIQILQQNTFLQSCDPISVKNAIVNVALTGLTLNPALKMAYLVPRKGKCVLDPSYVGLIKVLTDSGAVKNIDAAVIYANDSFEFEKGTEPFIRHKPALANRGEMIGAYAIAYFRDGGSQFEVLPKEDIDKIKGTSESYKNEKTRNYSPWETWEDEMWKKTAIKRLYKLLPKTKFSENLIAALSVDFENEKNDLVQQKKDGYDNLFDEAEEVR